MEDRHRSIVQVEIAPRRLGHLLIQLRYGDACPRITGLHSPWLGICPPREQECRYLVKDFGTSQSPKSTRQRDSRYCP
ncbi:MAG: hypothetical protein AB2807_10115, partial [Candidatus Sedimenticola endophacoides]